MGEYTFDFAIANDETQIKDLLNDCGLPWEDITPSLLMNFIVLKDELGIVGVIGMEVFDDIALLRSLAVRSRDRNQGVASNLIKRAEDHAQSLGIRTLYLLTITAADFLDQRGYQRSERSLAPALVKASCEFQGLCPVSAVCMVKSLRDESLL